MEPLRPRHGDLPLPGGEQAVQSVQARGEPQVPMVHSQVSSWVQICRLGQAIVSGTKYGQSSPYRHPFSDRLKVQRRLQDAGPVPLLIWALTSWPALGARGPPNCRLQSSQPTSQQAKTVKGAGFA